MPALVAAARKATYGRTVSRLAQPEMPPTERIAAFRKEHPNALKEGHCPRCILCFYAVILAAEHATGRVSDLRRLAVEARNTRE
jgi:hypothetical protein